MSVLQNQHRDHLLSQARTLIDNSIRECLKDATNDEKYMLNNIRSNKLPVDELLQNDIVLDLNCLNRQTPHINSAFVQYVVNYLFKLGKNTNKYLKEFGDKPEQTIANLILVGDSSGDYFNISGRLIENDIKYKRVADKKILIANVTAEEVQKIVIDELVKNYLSMSDRVAESIIKRDTQVPGPFDWIGELFSKLTENLVLLIVSIFLVILLIVCAPAIIQPAVEDIKV